MVIHDIYFKANYICRDGDNYQNYLRCLHVFVEAKSKWFSYLVTEFLCKVFGIAGASGEFKTIITHKMISIDTYLV